MTERRLDRWLPACLALAAVCYLAPLRRHGLMTLDDGWYLQPVMRMQTGEILYRDVWTFYAPGMHHLLEAVFALFGTSILVARGLWIACIAATCALSYRFARRFTSPAFAVLPSLVYAAIPGPWHKAYYATLTAAFFVLLARALERPLARRYAALGAFAGSVLMTRQDLGLAQLGIGLVAAVVPAVAPALFAGGAPSLARAMRHAALFAVSFAVPVAACAAYYAAHGALAHLVEAVFVRAFAQAGAHPALLGHILSTATFLQAPEGRAVGALMLLPLGLYAGWAWVLVQRVRRDGLRRDHVLLGSLLAFAVATLTQAYAPMLLLRLLQSALPFYLLAAIALGQGAAALRARGRVAEAQLLGGAGWAAAAALAALVIFGVPLLRQPIYTGSIRMLAYDHPVDVLGDRFYETFEKTEEIRLVRAYFAERVPPGEPTLGLPAHALYNALLERPNPIAYVHDHPSGDFIMTPAHKQREAARLLASPARHVLVDQSWWAAPKRPDPLLAALRAEFHPVRGYGSLLVLERGNDADWAHFAAAVRRAITGQSQSSDPALWTRFARTHPQEPIAWRMDALGRRAAGDAAGEIDALGRAAALDPADATALERRAELLLALGRGEEALADVGRARAVRPSAALDALAARLAPSQQPR